MGTDVQVFEHGPAPMCRPTPAFVWGHHRKQDPGFTSAVVALRAPQERALRGQRQRWSLLSPIAFILCSQSTAADAASSPQAQPRSRNRVHGIAKFEGAQTAPLPSPVLLRPFLCDLVPAQKPPVGFDPTTSRLLSGCSTS